MPSLAQMNSSTAPNQLKRLKQGKGKFVFSDRCGNTRKPIKVWYYKPARLEANAPIVFVMHGVERNALDYRNSWQTYAQKYGFLLLAPQFAPQYYPKARHYQQGNMFTGSGKVIAPRKWTFTAIEHLFDYVKMIEGLTTPQYRIYGHSAGAQFVHRLVMFKPDARFDLAIAANAGWYTMPDYEADFPYGLANSGIGAFQLERVLSKKLLILLGTADIDPNHKHLRQTPEVASQGQHRLARGKAFYQMAKVVATEQDIQFSWQIKEIDGVEHSDAGMSVVAAKFLLGGMPSLLKTYDN